MISTDLKLLVAIGWENRIAQSAVLALRGEHAAAKRLVRRGLLVEIGSMRYGLTGDGERLLRRLDSAALSSTKLRLVR